MKFNTALTDDLMETIASYMDNEIREDLHSQLAPCTHEEFISAYLERDPNFVELLKNEFGYQA